MRAASLWLACCLLASASCLALGTAESVEVEVGEAGEYSIQAGQINFVFFFNRTEEDQSPALRLVLSSDNASIQHPLLITARQSQGVSSLTIPYVESGFTFSSVERTLCPLLNGDPDAPPGSPLEVVVEVSTSSPTPVNFTLGSFFVDNFYHRLNVPASMTATPSGPAYILFEHSPETSRVRVRFTSTDDTANVCAIASIQKSFCPVVELLDNPDHRGTFQTMRSQAALNIEMVSIDEDTDVITDRQQTQFSFFYIVVSIFPSNDTCQSMGVATTSRLITLDVADNFNPEPFTGNSLTKNVSIIIETSFPSSGYGVAIVVPIIIYFLCYFAAVSWILLADWHRHWHHPMEELIEERKMRLAEHDALEYALEGGLDLEGPASPLLLSPQDVQMEPDPESGLTTAASKYARQTSGLNPDLSLGSEYNSQSQIGTPPTSYEGTDGPGITTDHTPTNHAQIPKPGSGRARGTPSPQPSSPTHLISPAHPADPAHLPSPASSREETDHGHSFKKYFQRSHRSKVTDSAHLSSSMTKKPSLLSVLTGNQYDVVRNQAPPPPAQPHRPGPAHSTISPSYAQPHLPGPAHQAGSSVLMRSTSLGSPYKLPGHALRPRLPPSINLMSPVAHQSLHRKRRVHTDGAVPTDSPDFAETKKVDFDLQPRPRAASYSQAVETGLNVVRESPEKGVAIGSLPPPEGATQEEGRYCHDKCPFPVNLYMCELPEFDETSHVQKQYNLLSWYLVAVIIFYAIPAYQLVITYQQLLTLSGNHDLCYYNSLCSHSWRISNSLTFTAFNNICSNTGYFILGLLFILIAYRRRRVYRAVEEVVNNPFITNREERVGVPQHFGIYYAIGMALIAEGFMSVAYHICPGKTNYQFDTTFMFVLAGLGIFKLLEGRNPDKHPGFQKLLVLVAAMIVMVVIGVLASSLAFYIMFFFVHVLMTFVVTVEYYYRWEVKRRCAREFLRHLVTRPFWPPKQIPKFVMCVLSNLVNWGFALYAIAFRPPDFSTFFLSILLTNFILLLVYYMITKVIYKERPSFRPILFLVLALVSWAIGIFFYTRSVTNWLESPAVSRDGNRECIVPFYDSHDMWHFTSAFALFFSFLMLMTIDDDTEGTPRTKLRVF